MLISNFNFLSKNAPQLRNGHPMKIKNRQYPSSVKVIQDAMSWDSSTNVPILLEGQ